MKFLGRLFPRTANTCSPCGEMKMVAGQAQSDHLDRVHLSCDQGRSLRRSDPFVQQASENAVLEGIVDSATRADLLGRDVAPQRGALGDRVEHPTEALDARGRQGADRPRGS